MTLGVDSRTAGPCEALLSDVLVFPGPLPFLFHLETSIVNSSSSLVSECAFAAFVGFGDEAAEPSLVSDAIVPEDMGYVRNIMLVDSQLAVFLGRNALSAKVAYTKDSECSWREQRGGRDGPRSNEVLHLRRQLSNSRMAITCFLKFYSTTMRYDGSSPKDQVYGNTVA